MTLKKFASQLAAKGTRYWILVALAIAVGEFAGSWMDEKMYFKKYRYMAYEKLHIRWLQPRAERTVLVLITDDDYWKGVLGRRVPIKRDYLARLVNELAAANAGVIALDFNLASPMPHGTVIEHPDYKRETNILLRTIKSVSERRKVVLPKTVSFDRNRDIVLLSDIYDGFDFGPRNQNISTGYIAPGRDLRQIAGTVPLKGRGHIDSFAMAIVKAHDPDALKRLPKSDSFLYGGYLIADDIPTFSAEDVLRRRTDVIKKLACKIVIVSGGWHTLGHGRGAHVDLHYTPVGWIGGAFIHANWVEALMDGRASQGLHPAIARVIVTGLVLSIAIVFALKFRARVKVLIIASLCLFLFVVSYILLQNLGQFFDFSVPLILIVMHWRYERYRECKEYERDALKYRAQGKGVTH